MRVRAGLASTGRIAPGNRSRIPVSDRADYGIPNAARQVPRRRRRSRPGSQSPATALEKFRRSVEDGCRPFVAAVEFDARDLDTGVAKATLIVLPLVQAVELIARTTHQQHVADHAKRVRIEFRRNVAADRNY